MLAFVKKLLMALVLFAVVIFLYQNRAALSANVPFRFDLGMEGYRYQTPEIPVWILFAVFFLLGMVAAGFHGIYERLARRVEIRRRDKKIRGLEQELGELRARVAELRPPAPSEDAAGSEPPALPAETGRRERQDSGSPRPPVEEEPTL